MAGVSEPRRAGVQAGNASPVEVAEVEFWRRRVGRSIGDIGTPAFFFAAEPLSARAAVLDGVFAGLPVRHWWSFKTLPLRVATDWWRRRGGGVEVVSEFEWLAARDLGFEVGSVLINGPGKAGWLGRHATEGMRVNFDSAAEVRALAPIAGRLGWHVGVRLGTAGEDNIEFPGVRAQFGMLGAEVVAAARCLRRAGVEVGVVHFHLRTNVPEAGCYRAAADEAMAVGAAAGWRPRVLDIGGGFPAARVATRKGAPLDAGFSMSAMRSVVASMVKGHGLAEVWMENGRWMTAPAGVLAIRVLDVKEGRGVRTLICDGGRTMQALVATWERHALVPLIPRRGRRVPTLLCGPTCMAFDNLGIHELPGSLAAGDVLVWFDAGAYQTSWESRFSHGLAPIAWCEGAGVRVVREREGFRDWMETR